mmetsp:Transcript_11156/g.29743  ORF Transcript_11156/g.29743 Transcript_11156/m.29743 type:complete len:243 (+) Transcript_11156:1-729(+)
MAGVLVPGRNAAVGPLMCLGWLALASATTLRGAPRVLAAGSTNRTTLAKAQLPSECDRCQGSGIVDPFMATQQYCKKNYDTCKCCQEALQAEKYRICTSGKGGSTFMGYGDCADGIQAAMREKEADCKHQQAINDYNKDRSKEAINEALGDRSPYASSFALSGAGLNASTNASASANASSSGYVSERYGSECAAYSEPNCAEWAGPLCQNGFGCNDQLKQAEGDLATVKDYYGMYLNTPCYR